MLYSLPYILLVLLLEILAVCSITYDRDTIQGKSMIFWCFAILLVFFGLRGYICDDWINYTKCFDVCSLETINPFFITEDVDETGRMEPGFAALMYACKLLGGGNYVFFQFVCTAINLSLLYIFLKNNVRNIPFGLLMFLCFGGYVMMTNLMRNSIAILIMVNAFQYIVNKEPKKYFLCCFMAFMFHISSVIFIPLYFVLNRKLNKWVWLAIFVACNVIFLLHVKWISGILDILTGGDSKIITQIISAYTEEYDTAKGLSIGYLERLMSGILIFCFYDTLIKKRDDSPLYVNIFLIYILLSLLLAEFAVMAERVSLLFIMGYWTIWNDLILTYQVKNNRYLFCAFIFVYCLFKMNGLTNLITSEYDNHLFGAKSYQERLSIHNKNSQDQ